MSHAMTITGSELYHDALRQARLAIRYSDGTEEDMPLEEFINQRDDAKADALRLHKDKMAFLERLLTCRLRCGYIINHCRDHAQAKGEAEEMLRVIEGVVPASAPRAEVGDKNGWIDADKQLPEEGDEVLCWWGGSTFVAYVIDGKWKEPGETSTVVTYWHPLPKDPHSTMSPQLTTAKS